MLMQRISQGEEQGGVHILIKGGSFLMGGVGAVVLIATLVQGLANGIFSFLFSFSVGAVLTLAARDMCVVIRHEERMAAEEELVEKEGFIFTPATTEKENKDPNTWLLQHLKSTAIRLESLFFGKEDSLAHASTPSGAERELDEMSSLV